VHIRATGLVPSDTAARLAFVNIGSKERIPLIGKAPEKKLF
jgi:hypothetical protein